MHFVVKQTMSPIPACRDELSPQQWDVAEDTALHVMQLLGKFFDNFLPLRTLFDVVGWIFQESSESHIGVAGSVCLPTFLSQKINEANVFPGFECFPEDLFQLIVPSQSRLTLCAWSAGYLMCELATCLVSPLHGHASVCYGRLRVLAGFSDGFIQVTSRNMVQQCTRSTKSPIAKGYGAITHKAPDVFDRFVM
ncbi:unnamed protein product [Trypanosoma congolense IL3000]|uniref:WGS project CAEQ00000000 data, annotated contig 181 n=1 Tax=Trypanosoma congolense (strain IL3000) TaxID=1068625 RepID=F9W920_TRYCI|nr:unnamed protein product [Trypanosoma congolense IL3000]